MMRQRRQRPTQSPVLDMAAILIAENLRVSITRLRAKLTTLGF
jgi:hypothetical protein